MSSSVAVPAKQLICVREPVPNEAAVEPIGVDVLPLLIPSSVDVVDREEDWMDLSAAAAPIAVGFVDLIPKILDAA